MNCWRLWISRARPPMMIRWAFVTRLHPTLLSELPSLYRVDLASHDAWEMSDRSGSDIVLSFLADLAMLSADVLMRAKRGCFLGLNLDRADRNMYSYRRPCLLGLRDRFFPQFEKTYFLEEVWFGYYANMDDPTRLAAPDRVVPEAYGLVIGGTILTKLDRGIVVPGATDEAWAEGLRSFARRVSEPQRVDLPHPRQRA